MHCRSRGVINKYLKMMGQEREGRARWGSESERRVRGEREGRVRGECERGGKDKQREEDGYKSYSYF
jgi:hypothetical protein